MSAGVWPFILIFMYLWKSTGYNMVIYLSSISGIDTTLYEACLLYTSMGQRDAMIENGVEFLYTNIHTHHGMYPLYQNQKPYFLSLIHISKEVCRTEME